MRLFKTSERTQSILKQIGFSSIYKAFSIAISFFLVPLSISYLGSEKYGLWLTVFSFIGWFGFFDFGIGNGLRNKLAIALSSQNIKLARSYVSTAYFGMSFVIVILSIVFFFLAYFINWEHVFNYHGDESLNQLMALLYLLFSLNLVLKMITAVYYADQKPSMINMINMIGQVIIFLSIYIVSEISNASLLLYGFIVMGAQTLTFILVTIVAFYGKYSSIKPSIKSFDKEYIFEIMSLGGKFFLIQISAVVIYSTDNFIINYYLGSEQVTIYNIALKYFAFVTIAMSLILEPYWSSFTNAIVANDMKWIKQSIKNLLKISIVAAFIIFFMIIISKDVYLLWIGSTIQVPYLLTILIAFNTLIQVFMQPIIMYINGSGKLKLQLYIGIVAACVNVPLSILLANYYELGVFGVVLATIITRLLGVAVHPLQVYKLINNQAKGIWNE